MFGYSSRGNVFIDVPSAGVAECSSQAPKRHLRALHHGAQLGLNPTKTTMWETPLFLPAVTSKPGTLIPYWNPADHGKTSGKNPAIQSGGGNSVGWGEFGRVGGIRVDRKNTKNLCISMFSNPTLHRPNSPPPPPRRKIQKTYVFP